MLCRASDGHWPIWWSPSGQSHAYKVWQRAKPPMNETIKYRRYTAVHSVRCVRKVQMSRMRHETLPIDSFLVAACVSSYRDNGRTVKVRFNNAIRPTCVSWSWVNDNCHVYCSHFSISTLTAFNTALCCFAFSDLLTFYAVGFFVQDRQLLPSYHELTISGWAFNTEL